VWLDRNLGASKLCTSSTDADCYGNLYQWGRNDDGHEDRKNDEKSSVLASSITNANTDLFIANSGGSDWVGANVDSNGSKRADAWVDGGSNDICPAGFSVPTEAELAAETTKTTKASITNTATAFSSFLKLPAAGNRFHWDGMFHNVNSVITLWSRSASTSGLNSYSLFIGSDSAIFINSSRAKGASIRCIKTHSSIVIKPEHKETGTISFNELTYKTLASPHTSRVWLDRNLGASKPCTSFKDADCYGDLYQWGRNDDGHEDRTNTNKSSTLASSITNTDTGLFIASSGGPDWVRIHVDSNGNKRVDAWAGDGSNNICPAGFSVPTETELAAETTKANVSNVATAFSSFLKLPAAGNRFHWDGKLHNVGATVGLWSRSASNSGLSSYSLFVGNGNATFINSFRAEGFSVRCIKTQGSIISFNGLIYKTLASPYTGRVWLDRNLGASKVCTSSKDADCYGGLYQWGRNDDGHEDRTNANESSALASSIANAGTDLFITGVFDWTIDAIDRSGVAREAAWTDGGVNDICPVGFSVPTKEELMVEITKANITNTVSAFSSFLKLPAAGRRLNWYGKFQGISSITSMWSRSASDSGLSSHSLFVDSGDAVSIIGSRSEGMSIRCIETQAVVIPPEPEYTGDNTISLNGLTYKLIVSPHTGRIWLDRNTGASQVATSRVDTASYGGHYTFGGNHSVCPIGFSVPTEAELRADTISAGVTNLNTAFSSFLKLPSSGIINGRPSTALFMWTRTASGPSHGRFLNIDHNTASFWKGTHDFTLNVRCIKTQIRIVIPPNPKPKDKETGVISFNGLTYKTVASPYTGRVWLDRNLGARRVAIKSKDTAAYGYLYQWGRNNDGHEGRSSGKSGELAFSVTNAGTDLFITGNSDWTRANVDSEGDVRVDAWKDGGDNDICPVGFRVPTGEELMAEATKANIDNTAAAFSSFLKLPASGWRFHRNGELPKIKASAIAALWSRSATGLHSRALFISNDSSIFMDSPHGDGVSVRCIETQAGLVIPLEPKDKETNTILFNGLTYKTLVSPHTGRIWLDRNIGAKRVATSSTDSSAYGGYYKFDEANVCPTGFSVPTEAEMTAETVGADVNNTTTAFTSFLKIPAAGSRIPNGVYDYVGFVVYMWTQTAVGFNGYYFYSSDIRAHFAISDTDYNFSVRCIKD